MTVSHLAELPVSATNRTHPVNTDVELIVSWYGTRNVGPCQLSPIGVGLSCRVLVTRSCI